MMYILLRAMSTPYEYKEHLDQQSSECYNDPYIEKCHACSFEHVSLYSEWLKYSTPKMRNLLKRVLHQIRHMQTIPRHPHENAPIQMSLGEIIHRYVHYLDHVLTDQLLGFPVIQGVEAELGYIIWFYLISHPHMILPNEDVQVPRPPEQEDLDEIVVEQDGEQGYLDLARRLSCIRDQVYVVMFSDVVARGPHNDEILRISIKKKYNKMMKYLELHFKIN